MNHFKNASALLALSPTEDWALGHFNIHNLEFAKAVVQAANEEKAPAIIAVGMGSVRYAGIAPLYAVAEAVAAESAVPLCLHLDHAKDLDTVREALELGFSSVMFDGSAFSYEENLRLTREVVRMAHDHGATAEGEIGIVPLEQAQLTPEDYTSPAQLQDFLEGTGVDFVAVSFGSAHNMTTQAAGLDLNLLKNLHQGIKTPFVLHGASGVIDADLAQAVRIGLRKVNVNTAMKVAMCEAMRTSMADPTRDMLVHLKTGIDAVATLVKGKMQLFGSSGKWQE